MTENTALIEHEKVLVRSVHVRPPACPSVEIRGTIKAKKLSLGIQIPGHRRSARLLFVVDTPTNCQKFRGYITNTIILYNII